VIKLSRITRRRITFGFVGTGFFIFGMSLIALASFGFSLNSTYLGYVGGVLMIGVSGYLILWELSHVPRLVQRK